MHSSPAFQKTWRSDNQPRKKLESSTHNSQPMKLESSPRVGYCPCRKASCSKKSWRKKKVQVRVPATFAGTYPCSIAYPRVASRVGPALRLYLHVYGEFRLVVSSRVRVFSCLSCASPRACQANRAQGTTIIAVVVFVVEVKSVACERGKERTGSRGTHGLYPSSTQTATQKEKREEIEINSVQNNRI